LSIEDLRGMGEQTRDRLKAAGITSLEALAMSRRSRLKYKPGGSGKGWYDGAPAKNHQTRKMNVTPQLTPIWAIMV
jgi:nucleotidyltransferase/DNA polymerase involved in DNA repair